MATSSACVNPLPGSALASACACQAAANALAASLTQYNAQYQQYAINQAIYTSALNKYNMEHAQWAANRDAKKAQLTNELKTMACGGCGTNQSCDVLGGGWVSTANPLACGRDLFGTPWGCNNICQRTADQVNTDLGTWAQSNPEPQPPPPVPAFSLQVPNGNNITCCSQEFSGITADSVSFNNVLQNCNQQIQKTIAAAATKPATLPQTPVNQTPIQTPVVNPKPISSINSTKTSMNTSSTYLVIFGIICGLLLLCVAIIFVGYLATNT